MTRVEDARMGDKAELGDFVECRNVPFKGATGHVIRVTHAFLGRRTYTVRLEGQSFTGGKIVRGITNVRRISDAERRLWQQGDAPPAT